MRICVILTCASTHPTTQSTSLRWFAITSACSLPEKNTKTTSEQHVGMRQTISQRYGIPNSEFRTQDSEHVCGGGKERYSPNLSQSAWSINTRICPPLPCTPKQIAKWMRDRMLDAAGAGHVSACPWWSCTHPEPPPVIHQPHEERPEGVHEHNVDEAVGSTGEGEHEQGA